MIEWNYFPPNSFINKQDYYYGRKNNRYFYISPDFSGGYSMYSSTLDSLMAGATEYRLIGEFSELEQAKAAAELLI